MIRIINNNIKIKGSGLIIFLILVVSFLFSISNLLFVYPTKATNFNDIIISEIMYDLPGSDDDHEWIEIQNISSSEINLKGWRFNDGSNHLLNEPPKNGGQGSLNIPAGGYAILADNATIFLQDHPGFSGIVIDTLMSLSNTSGVLKIIDDSGQIIDQVQHNKDQGANGDGYTLERKSAQSADFCPSKNLGGSPDNTNNPNCFSPTPTPTPSPSPTSSPSPSPSPSPQPTISNIPKLVQVGEILITELMANPPTGENEWIEIYNRTSREIDLTGLTIEDNTGPTFGTGRGKALDGLTIPAYSYLVLTKGQNFNFGLNNSGDIVILKRDNLIIDQITYGDFEDSNLNDNAPKPEQEIALARSGDLIDTDWDAADFHLTSQSTLGFPNLILEPKSESETEEELEEKISPTHTITPSPSPSIKPTISPKTEVTQEIPPITDLTTLRNLEKGASVKIQGIVIVEPGILGKNIFYLNGLQVYSYRQDFPELNLGDRVEINGELSEINGETRIKIKTKNDVKILDKEIISPQVISAEDIEEELEGRLIALKGQVIEKTGSRIYLDDGSGEAVIYFKTSAGLSKKEIKEGDYLTVTGIVSRGKQEWQILPRYQNDLKIVMTADNEELKSVNQPTEEINLITDQEEIDLTANNQRLSQNKLSKQLSSIGNLLNAPHSTIVKYLTITSSALFAFLFALIIKILL